MENITYDLARRIATHEGFTKRSRFTEICRVMLATQMETVTDKLMTPADQIRALLRTRTR